MTNDSLQSNDPNDAYRREGQSDETCRGALGESANLSTYSDSNIDLTKPGDIALLHRAVVNGWDVPQAKRDQLSAQIGPAFEVVCARMDEAEGALPKSSSQFFRRTNQVIKFVKLILAMEARNRIDAGYARTLFPYIRKRYPQNEHRQIRKGSKDAAAKQAAQLAKLLDQLTKGQQSA